MTWISDHHKYSSTALSVYLWMVFMIQNKRIGKRLGCGWLFYLCGILLFIPYSASFAMDRKPLCVISKTSLQYAEKSLRYSEAIDFYLATLKDNPDLRIASKPQAMNFPTTGSSIQFFYYSPEADDADPYLVGCIHSVDADGKNKSWLNKFAPEGGNWPIIEDVFQVDLKKPYGNTLFMILRWDTGTGGGTGSYGFIYELDAYGMGMKSADRSPWNYRSDLGRSINKSGPTGFDGVEEGKEVHYPYKTKIAVIKRLQELGYLK